jgi:hypothetical protein
MLRISVVGQDPSEIVHSTMICMIPSPGPTAIFGKLKFTTMGLGTEAPGDMLQRERGDAQDDRAKVEFRWQPRD